MSGKRFKIGSTDIIQSPMIDSLLADFRSIDLIRLSCFKMTVALTRAESIDAYVIDRKEFIANYVKSEFACLYERQVGNHLFLWSRLYFFDGEEEDVKTLINTYVLFGTDL